MTDISCRRLWHCNACLVCRSGFTPLPQHCNWKYLLNWPPQSSYSASAACPSHTVRCSLSDLGATPSTQCVPCHLQAHLKSFMSCGSAVVSAGPESGWHEFWCAAERPLLPQKAFAVLRGSITRPPLASGSCHCHMAEDTVLAILRAIMLSAAGTIF